MTIKRLILSLLTILAVVRVLFSLQDSFSQPQIQSRLELYQTNLLLHAAEVSDSNFIAVRNVLVGPAPLAAAEEQYLRAREVTEKSLANFQGQQPDLEQFLDEIDLKLGIIQAKHRETQKAITTWQKLIERERADDYNSSIPLTAEVLIKLWRLSPVQQTDIESILTANLDGWFLYAVREQLDLVSTSTWEVREEYVARQALFKLALISTIPLFTGILGIGLGLFLLVQWFIKRETAILTLNSTMTWEVPWDGEVVWQVLIIGFFLIAQLVVPLLLGILGIEITALNLRLQAGAILVTYILLAMGGLSVLYFSLKPFFPLPSEWLKLEWQGNWFIWGLGGYLVALPLVVLVSLINQQIWQGQGGSNPLLFLALQAQDRVALAMFFLTASLAAPIFEEIIFRGFLLPSLTRYLPVWGSIAVSSLIFSAAHLSLSEVLPLMTLGIVLGFVYTRSRNLLAPMLLHSLWNSGTLFSLFLLGSGG